MAVQNAKNRIAKTYITEAEISRLAYSERIWIYVGRLALNTSLLGNCTPVESLKREKDRDWITAKTVNSDLEREDAMQTETQRLSFSLLHLHVDVFRGKKNESLGYIWREGRIKEWLDHNHNTQVFKGTWRTYQGFMVNCWVQNTLIQKAIV